MAASLVAVRGRTLPCARFEGDDMKKFWLLGGLCVATWVQAAGLPAGDVERGRLAFASCRTCHYPEQAVGHHNGPSLWNVFGRRAGSTDFEYYSSVLKGANFTWTPELLDHWLSHPDTFLKGSAMVILPVKNAQDRADLIEYLKQFSPR